MAKKEEISAYKRVQIVRHKDRPKVNDYVEALFDDFIELCGDRLARDDKSILGGIASFHGIPVTVIGHRKGKNLEENVKYNFGMASPEGYRKALRLMEQAEKFNRPIITFIDTPGAYPGMEAEENGQSVAIATNIAKMSGLKTPIISVVTGEGSSGGALAIGISDKIIMLENAIYAVLSPEGFASILWKDSKRVKEACEVMNITADSLYKFGIIDGVVREEESITTKDGFEKMIRELDSLLIKEITSLNQKDKESLVNSRYEKYRHIEGERAPVLNIGEASKWTD